MQPITAAVPTTAALPDWAASLPRTELTTLLLLGTWAPGVSEYEEAARSLGSTPAQVTELCEALCQQSPPQVLKQQSPYDSANASSQYLWADRRATWWLLVGMLDNATLDRFVQVVQVGLTAAPLATRSDRVQLSARTASGALHQGLAESLALLGHSDDLASCDPGPSQRATQLVTSLLAPQAAEADLAVSSWDALRAQRGVLPLLAEASADAFLAALQSALQLPSDPAPEGPLVSALCRALATLAWDMDLLEPAALLLAQLSRRVPVTRDSRTSQPLQSLIDLFVPWMPQTCAPIDERLAVLQGLCSKVPDVAWQLLLDLLRGGSRILHPARKPWVYANWLPPENRVAYGGEGYAQIELVLMLACELAAVDGARWAQLLGKLTELPKGLPEKLMQALRAALPQLQDPAARVWTELGRCRAQLQRQLQWTTERAAAGEGTAAPTVGGADSADSRLVTPPAKDPWELQFIKQQLKPLIQALTPSDLLLRVGRLFQAGAGLVFSDVSDVDALRAEQQRALTEISQRPNRVQLLERLVVQTENLQAPWLAEALVASPMAAELFARLQSPAPLVPFEKLAPRFLVLWLHDRPFSELAQLVHSWVAWGRSDDAARVLCEHRQFDIEKQVWDLVDAIGEPLLSQYWRGHNGRLLTDPRRETAQQLRAVSRLLQFQNWESALQATYRSQPPSLSTAEILEVLRQVAAQSQAISLSGLGRAHLAQLFKQLAPGSPAEQKEACLLELALLAELTNPEYELRFAPAHFTDHPQEFAALVQHCTEPTEASRAQWPLLDQATFATVLELLESWKSFPGAHLEAAAADDFLLAWCKAVQGTLAEGGASNKVRESAYYCLRELLIRPAAGADGIWPCVAARQFLQENEQAHPQLVTNFAIAKQNSRGVTIGGRDAGGNDEKDLARQFKDSAARLGSTWPAAKQLNLQLAEYYESNANAADQDAAASRLYMTVQEPKQTLRPLFPLSRVRIKNFRGISELELAPHPRLTLLFGKNASGKSTVLDGIACGLALLGQQLPSFLDSNPQWQWKRPEAKDLRRTWKDGKVTSEKGVEVQLSTQPQDSNSRLPSWQVVNRFGGKGPQAHDLISPDIAAQLKLITEALRTSDSTALIPVFAHYGVDRAVSKQAQTEVNFPKEEQDRMVGLQGALNSTARFEWTVGQIRVLQELEAAAQKTRNTFGYQLPQLELVRRAITACLKTPDGARCENPRVVPGKGIMVVDYYPIEGEMEPLELGQLSDGFRTHLALVMDLALRMILCNPPPDEAAALHRDGIGTRSYAVVLIDEIDLHLHPSWQHTVLRGLLDAFPNTQFFITTHSEQVLSSVDDKSEALVLHLRQVDHEIQAALPDRPLYGARGQDVLKEMEVPERPPVEITKSLERYLSLIDDGQGGSQQALELRERLDQNNSRDPALIRADIELRRQEGIAKRAKKP